MSATPDVMPDCGVALRCQVEEDFEGLVQFQPAWDEAVERLGSTIYMTYDWLRTWWSFYGGRHRLRLFLFWSDNRIVGLVPVYVEEFGFGMRVARLVGANIPPKTFDPPLDAAFTRPVLEACFRHLLEVDRCSVISLGPVSQQWAGAECLRAMSTGRASLPWKVQHQAAGAQTLFELPATFEEYLAGLNPSDRKSRLKRLRQLERNHSVRCDVVSEASLVEEEFTRFAEHHARQWAAVGKSGHFAAWPRALEYNRALVRAQGARGRVRFYRMLADDQVVVNRYTFQLGGTLYSELPARSVGEPWDKLGIGGTSMIKFNEAAIEQGIARIDSGLGDYEHKAQMGGQSVPVGVWYLTPRGSAGLAAEVLLRLARAFYALAHKGLYRRLLPALPGAFNRGQRMWWLRWHF